MSPTSRARNRKKGSGANGRRGMDAMGQASSDRIMRFTPRTCRMMMPRPQ
jgi:hypothetical protein